MARRGRPPLDPNDKTVGMQVRLPARQFDELQQLALHHRVSAPALARFAVRRLLKASRVSPRDNERP